ncbi:MAG: ATP-binding protein [Tissierellales bacterium]|jgi:ABC-type multidrug transport system ATPase subunit|nr:ATP-binding protein [Tissierellales bacterium]
MKLLKVKAKGLNLFSKELEIDFLALDRVMRDNNDMLFEISPKIYLNNVLAMIGINASGKTTTLKVISFVLNMLNNESINKIETNDILEGISSGSEVEFDVFFTDSSDYIFRLETKIEAEKGMSSDVDKYVIAKERLWSKKITSIKTKKSIFDFTNMEPIQVRKGDEEFLPEDISIIIALNKRNNSRVMFQDLINWTNVNLIRILGDFPQELISFLDSSIEYLNLNVDEEFEQDVELRLKFKGREEIVLYSIEKLNNYLSSGTVKGINVFINAMIVLSNGGYLIIDELENHFNKEIVATLIRFFMNKKVNKKGASIIFSTHYPELLDEFERKDNIYIIRNNGGIYAENLSKQSIRNDVKKSDAYQSDLLKGTAPDYYSYIGLKKVFKKLGDRYGA